MSWTDERVALLRRLWGEGKTAAEIAKELGGVTRNAVIGKAHRLKLSNRVSPIQQNKKPAKTPDRKAKTPIEDAAPVIVKPEKKTPAVAAAKNVKMIELTARMCRWPQGDPRDADFSFCGGPSEPGLPYCEEHARVAYQAAKRNRILKAEDFENQASDEDDRKEVA